jgi:hypothetical protein
MFHSNDRLFGAETRKARDVKVTLRRFAEYLSAYKLSLDFGLVIHFDRHGHAGRHSPADWAGGGLLPGPRHGRSGQLAAGILRRPHRHALP